MTCECMRCCDGEHAGCCRECAGWGDSCGQECEHCNGSGDCPECGGALYPWDQRPEGV